MSQGTQVTSSGATIEVVLFFLSDGVITLYGEHDPNGRIYECGDLLMFRRDSQSPLEAAIVMGSGNDEVTAIAESNAYFRQLAIWHGHDDASQVMLWGHDLSQNEFFRASQDNP